MRLAATLLGLAAASTAKPAHAEPSAPTPPSEHPSLWQQRWPQFSGTEAVLTLSASVGTVVLVLLTE